MAVSLSSYHGLSNLHPGLKEEATKLRSLYSSYKAPPSGHGQQLTFACSRLLLKGRINTPRDWHQTTTEHHLINPSKTPKGWSLQVHELTRANPVPRSQPSHSDSYPAGMANPHSQSSQESTRILMCYQQLGFILAVTGEHTKSPGTSD